MADTTTEDRVALHERMKLVANLSNAATRLFRERFGHLAGLSYDGERKIYKVAGYPEQYDFSEGLDRYLRQDVVRRYVDLPVDRTWRHPPEPTVDGDPEHPFCDEWSAMWKKLRMQVVAKQADRMASIGHYSLIVYGLSDARTDTMQAAEAGGVGAEGVLYAHAWKQSDITIKEWVEEPLNERFRMPEMYELKLGQADSVRSGDKAPPGVVKGTGVKVHWTRTQHIVEDPFDSRVYGLPVLERVINRCHDLEKIAASTGESHWQVIVPILAAMVDEEAAGDDEVMDAIEAALEAIIHNLRRHIVAGGFELEYLTADHVIDPKPAADMMLNMMSAARGIPKRVYYGSETGERASTQDQREFAAFVGERIEQFAEPVVVNGFTERMAAFGAVGEVPSGLEFVWQPVMELDELEQAQANESVAKQAKALAPVGANPRELVAVTEDGAIRLLTDEELEEMEEERRQRDEEDRDGTPPDDEEGAEGDAPPPPAAEGEGGEGEPGEGAEGGSEDPAAEAT